MSAPAPTHNDDDDGDDYDDGDRIDEGKKSMRYYIILPSLIYS